MIYVVLNAIMVGFLVWLAYLADRRSKNEDSNPLISLSLQLGFACLSTAIMIAASFRAPSSFILFLSRIMFSLFAFCSVDFALYAVTFPTRQLVRPLVITRYVLFALILLMAFTRFTGTAVSPFFGFKVYSAPVITGFYAGYFPYSWFQLYKGIFAYLLPALSVTVMMLRSEASENKLNFQKSAMAAISVIVMWIFLAAVTLAAKWVVLFSTLFPMALTLMLAILVYSTTQSTLFDFYFVLGQVLRFIACFVVPAAFIGFSFPLIWQIIATSLWQFIAVMLLACMVAFTISYQAKKLFDKFTGFRSSQYADRLEEELARMDYVGEPIEIVKSMESIFVRNIGVSQMRVLVDNGMGVLESVYNDETIGRKPISLNVSDTVFDSLLNQNRNIILRSIAEHTRTYAIDTKQLLDLFSKAESEAIILLTEGRHILGAILLDAKAGGNVYTEYDADVFSKLYSYFFVFGYYMKNIANQSVVGTVNREIHMSGQIITSIQENMDAIKNPKVDVGYIMKHAHNIGGEFVDLIKIAPDKHVFVLGDLSGKGISASMSMVIVKSIIRTYLSETKDFKLLIEKVNSFIRFNLPKGTFFEGVFGLIDFTANTMYYINCGVPALFLYSRSFNNIIEIQGEGRVLGFVKDIGPLIKVKKTNLNPGDIIFACTDGLIDCLSLRGEPFGKNRVQKSIVENLSYPAAKMAEFTYDSLINFISKELDDDVSIFVLKWLAK